MNATPHADEALDRTPAWAMALAVAGSAGNALADSWKLLLADLALARAASLRLLLCTLFGGLLLFATLLCLLAVLVVALLQSGQSPYLALGAAAGLCLLLACGAWCWSLRLIRDASLQASRTQLSGWLDTSLEVEVADRIARMRAATPDSADSASAAGQAARSTTAPSAASGTAA